VKKKVRRKTVPAPEEESSSSDQTSDGSSSTRNSRKQKKKPQAPVARPRYRDSRRITEAERFGRLGVAVDRQYQELVKLEKDRSPPILMIGSIIIMIGVFVAEYLQAGKFVAMSENPLWGPDESTMLILGAKYGPDISSGDWWRIATAIFTQNGAISLVISIFTFWFVREVEINSGFFRASILFIVSGLYGYILSCLMIPRALTCGTTPPLMGFLGWLYAYLLFMNKIMNRPIMQFILQTAVTLVLVFLGLTPYVDQWAHVGALIIGFLFALMLLPNLDFGKCSNCVHGFLAFLAFPCFCTLFMICFVMVFRVIDPDTSWCPGCDKINNLCLSGWCQEKRV
jgi:membrane associated rhomboid family serine protease